MGLVLTLEQAATLDRLEIDSPTNGWRARIYVAASPAPELAGWGEPVAVTEGIPAGTGSIDFDDAEGTAVLVWIVDRGDAPGRAAAEISEIRAFGS